MSVRFPVAQKYTHRVLQPWEVDTALLDDLLRLYGHIADLRNADLQTVWRVVRELTLALDRWGRKLGDVSGAEKMEIALYVAWELIERWGGEAVLRELVIDAVEETRFGRVGGWLARRFLTEGNLRRLVRFVLELSVRELRLFTEGRD